MYTNPSSLFIQFISHQHYFFSPHAPSFRLQLLQPTLLQPPKKAFFSSQMNDTYNSWNRITDTYNTPPPTAAISFLCSNLLGPHLEQCVPGACAEGVTTG